MRYTTILFDFDDTLIDTQGYATKCLETLYTKYDLNHFFPTSIDFINIYHKHVGLLWEEYALAKIDKQTLLNTRFDGTFKNFPNAERDFLKTLSNDFIQLVVKNNTHIDGAQEILEYLKGKYQIVMLSNGFSEMQYDKLENAGFTNYFDDVILSDVIGINKPHPDIFKFALNKLGTTAERTIMIGDNYLADIKGAIDSNIDQIWYNPRKEKAEIAPTYTIESLYQIKDIL